MCIDACVYFTLCSGYTLHYFETDNLFDKTVGPLNAGESSPCALHNLHSPLLRTAFETYSRLYRTVFVCIVIDARHVMAQMTLMNDELHRVLLRQGEL